jgi:hypothetical protein
MLTLPTNAKQYLNCFLVIVTPEMAKQWLLKNNFNRPLKPKLVDNYVRQIEAGNWRRTHQGIAFDEEGVVLDGQHRLHAIIRTGQSLPMLIFLNENQSAHESIDGGKPRTLLDVVRLELLDDTIKGKHISVLKEMWAGRYCKSQNHLSATEVINIYRRHHQAVRFAVDMLENNVVNNTTLIAVVARASHTVPKEKVLEFCNILRTGTGEHPSAKLVLEFRAWLLRLRDRQEATRREIYKRAETVLLAFVNNDTSCEMAREHKDFCPLYSRTA